MTYEEESLIKEMVSRIIYSDIAKISNNKAWKLRDKFDDMFNIIFEDINRHYRVKRSDPTKPLSGTFINDLPDF